MHLRWGERQQGSQNQWCNIEAVWGKALEVALAVFNGRDRRVPIFADKPEMEQETAERLRVVLGHQSPKFHFQIEQSKKENISSYKSENEGTQ